MTRAALVLLVLAACSVEKMPPIRMVNRGTGPAHRAIVLPTDCVATESAGVADDPRAWCSGLDAIVGSDLAFRGIDLVDLAKLPVRERTRVSVQVTSEAAGVIAERKTVTVSGPMFSDVDMWTKRAALAELGVDTLVRVRVAHLPTYPVRVLALVKMVRASDASLIGASVCELEVSRLDSEAEASERATRCALKGIVL